MIEDTGIESLFIVHKLGMDGRDYLSEENWVMTSFLVTGLFGLDESEGNSLVL